MDSRAISLFLVLNVLFFTMVSSTKVPSCPPPPHPKTPRPPPSGGKGNGQGRPPPSHPKAPPPSGGNGNGQGHNTSMAKCPNDILQLGVCGNLLNNLVNLVVGTPSNTPCCTLIGGLADLDAAVCLCTAIRANVLGINLNVPVSLSLLLNYCGKQAPSGFQCA